MYEDYDLDMYVDGEEQNEFHFDDQPSDRTEEELDFYFDDDEECDPENPDDNH